MVISCDLRNFFITATWSQKSHPFSFLVRSNDSGDSWGFAAKSKQDRDSFISNVNFAKDELEKQSQFQNGNCDMKYWILNFRCDVEEIRAKSIVCKERVGKNVFGKIWRIWKYDFF